MFEVGELQDELQGLSEDGPESDEAPVVFLLSRRSSILSPWHFRSPTRANYKLRGAKRVDAVEKVLSVRTLSALFFSTREEQPFSLTSMHVINISAIPERRAASGLHHPKSQARCWNVTKNRTETAATRNSNVSNLVTFGDPERVRFRDKTKTPDKMVGR